MTEAARLEERRDELTESVEDLAVYSEKDRAVAGVIVTIGDDGEFRLHEGLVECSATDTGDGETVGFKARRDDEISGPSPTAGQTIRKECGFSQLLVDDLKAHRLQITRAHLAADFDVAFDLVLYGLCVDLFERFGYRSHPLELRAIETPLHSSFNDLAGTPADRLLEAQGRALDLDWLKLPPAEGFAALAALPSEVKQRLFARCIAALPQAAAGDRGRGRSGHRSRRPAARDPVCRLLAADRRQLLGPGQEGARPRDRQGDPRRALGSRSRRRQEAGTRRGVGNRLRFREKHRLHRSRPGGARGRCGLAAARHGLCRCCRGQASADPQCDEAAPLAGDPDDAEPAEIDLAAAELPAFLTEDEPVGTALNGASAP